MAIALLSGMMQPFERARAQRQLATKKEVVMDALGELLPVENILLDVELADRGRLFEVISKLWPEVTGVVPTQVVAALKAREELGSTGLGKGVAIPHARLDGLTNPLAAFVRSKSPLAFDAPDGELVRLLFVLLVPKEAAATHLGLLAQFAERFADAKFREDVSVAPSALEVRRHILDWRSPIS